MVETTSPINLVRLNARHPMRCVLGPVSVLKFIWRCSKAKEYISTSRRSKKVATLFDGSGQSELIREIRAAAELSHPNIVRVYGAEKRGTAAGVDGMSSHRLST